MKPRRTLLLVLLALGCVWFGWRGPVRAALPRGNFDFQLFYSASRAWLAGENPYDLDAVGRAWDSGGGIANDNPRKWRPASSLVYGPPTFALLAPVAALPWSVAGKLWIALNVGLCGLALWMLAGIAGLRGDARLAFLAFCIWIAAFSTTIYVGQLGMAALALIVAGSALRRCSERRGRVRSGVLLGIAAVLKPQMGLLFLVYEAGRMRWTSLAGGLLVGAVLIGVGVARLEIAEVDWYPAWRGNLRAFVLTDEANPSRSNPIGHQMVNLSYLVHGFVDDPDAVRTIVYAVLLALCGAYFFADLRRGGQDGEGGEDAGELLSLSMTAVVTLLITYHRYYDAVLLALPAALAVRGIFAGAPGNRACPGRPARWMYGAVLVLMAPFLVPGAIALAIFRERGHIPEWATSSPLWETVIMPHATWALLLLCGWLVYLRWRTAPPISA